MSAARRSSAPIVYIVDDDLSVRESLEALIAHEGWRPVVFASAEAFLAHVRPAVPSCLVLDLGLPDLDGLELQKRLLACYAALSPREQDVLALVVPGNLNKQVAATLGLSEVTVKGHRGRMMRKMGAKSFAELVNMADRLGLETAGKT